MSIFARPLGLFNDLEPIEMHFDWRRGGKTTGGGPLAAGTDAATDCLSLGSRRELIRALLTAPLGRMEGMTFIPLTWLRDVVRRRLGAFCGALDYVLMTPAV